MSELYHHPIRVTDCEERTSKNGNRYYSLTVEIVAGPRVGEHCYFDLLMREGKGLGWGRDKAKALLGNDALEEGEYLALTPRDFIGAEAWATVEIETPEGTSYKNVRGKSYCSRESLPGWGIDWRPPEGPSGLAPDPELDDFDIPF